VLDEFTKPKMLSTLDSAILIAKAKWDSGQNSHELELEKLEEFDDQIAKCTMVAPEDGVVKYAHVTDGRGDQEFIVDEGTVVRERQVIITLPNAESMRVNLLVNESLVQYVQPGLAAVISPVGFGDRVLHGEVERVNQYAEPTGWRQANVKEYKALVAIDQPTPELRAGMTAAVTIRCAEVPNALQVPVQAVYAHGRKLYCFVYKVGTWEAREVKPGPTNDKFFVIESGLNEGDQVAMNPRGYVDEVSLPKLSPEEAQRAVPQRAAGRRGRGEGRQGGAAGRPGIDQGPAEQSGERPDGEQPGGEQLREPDGTQPGDTRAPSGSGAAAQADQTAASSTAAAPASGGSGAGE
jgi:HlyD family secretion protein